MMMTEICIERAANGYTIECEYKPKPKAIKAGSMSTVEYAPGRKVEYVAVSAKDALKKVKELMAKMESGGEDGGEE